MYNEEEIFLSCPYCFQNISMVFESLYGGQTYIEDCEVCCSPIEISYKVENGEVILTNVRKG
ncbi:MAG: CPXCG motif-containing cysteine-rich protein [Halobacteriovoraceae bacterium]|nr:CPXCG motif-containing cysteine-rich protein [Halobacteriovoraceae bacterium]